MENEVNKSINKIEPLRKKEKALVVLLVLFFFFLGIYLGYNNRPEIDKITGLSNKATPDTVQADFSPFWKAWNTINEKYPDSSAVTAQNRVYGAIAGLVGSLNDPYSEFFKPDEAKIFEGDIAGNFTGIGMEVGMKDNILTVIAPLKDTPAEKAGIKSGDEIIKINDTFTSNLSIDEAVKLIRGDKGTNVKLSILHQGDIDPVDISVVRDTINIPTIDTEMRKDGVFVIHLYSFTADSADLFRDAMKKFTAAKTDKLLLDLRGNPGGYLDAAIDISSWFLPTGKTVVIEDYGKNKEQTVYRSKGYDIFSDKLKFAILIDGGSASASEIVSGAMQDNKRAILVGAQSYGKGSVQEVVPLTPDTIFKITVAKWLTPNGTSISAKGLTPDYKVGISKDDIKNHVDPQLDKAADLLDNWTPIK